MHTNTRDRLAMTGMLAILSLVGVVLMQGRTATAALQSECIGKPYGYPGCPTWEDPPASAKCGNAILDAGEQCDNGRFNGTGDCSDTCMQNKCGDGRLTPNIGEECEPKGTDIYAVSPDGSTLVKEKIYQDPPQCGNYCLAPRYENGVYYDGCKWVFGKQCETSQASSGSGSAAMAQASAASVSSAASSSKSSAASSVAALPPAPQVAGPQCGNGILNQDEECDDGNRNAVDGCTNVCTLPRCGDAVLQANEECDDGNGADGDSCTNACKRSRCGDGFTQAGEECDDGNQVESDSCSNSCRAPRCSDGIVQSGEECDDGNKINDDSCTITCELPSCGDKVIHAGEECDDGNQNNTDMCSNSCKRARCGDGLRQQNEQCDDGNDNSFDTCTTQCRFPVCGNGSVEGREECDDGNQSNLDTCSSSCKFARCGDGVQQPTEECDRGSNNSDTNPNACRLSCKNPTCGDNVRDQGEECDGGQLCSAKCTLQAGGLKPGAGTTNMQKLLIIGGMAFLGIILLAVSVIPFGSKGSLLGKFTPRKQNAAKEKTIEDIPLDQIEMPWHKW